LRDNHNLGVTDTSPICVSLTQVMVHCICTCSSQLWQAHHQI